MKKQHYLKLGALAFLSFTPGLALAEPGLLTTSAQAPIALAAPATADTDPNLPTIVVTATRLANDVRTVGSSVTVITAAELERKQKTTVAEALRSVPAVDVVQYGGTTSVFLRGAKSEHTLVLLDGVELNDPSDPGRACDLSHLTVANIERIEIVRGPQSTLYGSDAMAGVINIITKKGQGKASGYVAAEGGSFNTYKERAGLSGGTDLINYSLGLSRTDSDGISAAARKYGNHETDGYENTTVSSRIGISPSANFQADTVVRYVEAKTDLDNGGGAGMDDPNNTTASRQLALRTQARLALFDNFWEQKMGVSLGSTQRDYDNATDADHPSDLDNGRYEGQSLKFDWQHNLYLHETNTLTLGLETEREQMKSDYYSESAWGPYSSSFDTQTTRTAGYYLQDQINLRDIWVTTLGIRLDDHSRYGSESTYRFTSSYLLKASGTRFKGSYGTGFKAPSLYQLYDPTYGNRALDPEKSTGWDVGIEQGLGLEWLDLEVTYFKNEFKNMIGTVANRYTNVAKAETNGVEVVLNARPTGDLNFRAGYTCTATEDKATGADLLRRPQDKLFCDIDYRFTTKAHVSVGVISVGKREDVSFDPATWAQTSVKLDDYTLVNLALGYDVSEHLQLTARVDNLNDAHYEEAYGYGTHGRSAYAGVRMSF